MEGAAARLMALFLPAETRRRLRQQRLDDEAARDAMPWMDRIDLTVTTLRPGGGTRSPEELVIRPAHSYTLRGQPWFMRGSVAWNGQRISVAGVRDTRSWPCRAGGIRPGHDAAEVARAGIRPATSGDCSGEVAELAGVAVKALLTTYPMRRLYLLDRESRHLTVLPFLGLNEDLVGRLADMAGIPFRKYSLAHTAPMDKLCEALFPPSALAWHALPRHSEYLEWWEPGRPPG